MFAYDESPPRGISHQLAWGLGGRVKISFENMRPSVLRFRGSITAICAGLLTTYVIVDVQWEARRVEIMFWALTCYRVTRIPFLLEL
jgi:hypothetical protein